MERVNAILNHPLYKEYYEKLAFCEKDRIFCRHQMDHLLDVARIAWIQNLEQGLGFEKEVIYGAAVLHDIGKYDQYTNQTPHEAAGAQIAGRILNDLNVQHSGQPQLQFSTEEIEMILSAVLHHRRESEGKNALDRLLYISDKLSRSCFVCPAEAECNWSEEKKNRGIVL